MKRNAVSIEQKQKEILSSKGKKVKVSLNRGRKKVERFEAIIAEVYPAVFVLKIKRGDKIDRITASYGELICGDVRIKIYD